MSEFGQLAPAYNVPPAKGQFLEPGYYREMEIADKMRQDQMIGEATRALLRQQLNLPDNVDPFQLQEFSGKNVGIQGQIQNQNLAQATENRAQTAFKQQQDFGANYGNQVRQQFGDGDLSPHVRALLGAGDSTITARAIAEALAGESSQAGERKTRVDINNADNVAAAERVRAELDARSQAEKDKETRATTRSEKELADMELALQHMDKTGDDAKVLARYPQLGNSEVFALRREEARRPIKAAMDQQKLEAEQAAIRAKAAKEAAAKLGTTPEQQLELNREKVKQRGAGMSEADFIRQTILGTKSFGGGDMDTMNALKETNPELVREIFNRITEEKGAKRIEEKKAQIRSREAGKRMSNQQRSY